MELIQIVWPFSNMATPFYITFIYIIKIILFSHRTYQIHKGAAVMFKHNIFVW